METDSVNFLNILLTLFLVFLNGFFVAAEFAIVKVRSSQLDSLDSKKTSNLIARSILDNIEGYLAATQLGITIASLALGVVGEKTFTIILLRSFEKFGFNLEINTAHQIAIVLSFTFITILHIVFGELAPKSIGIRYAYKTTLFVAPILKAFRTIFLPFIYVLNWIANFILRVIGLKPGEEGEFHSEEELKLIIAESAEGGAIHANERELIHNVFDFDNRVVKEIYRHNIHVVGIPSNASFEEVNRIVLDEGYTRYPIYNESKENIIGMLHSKDLLRVLMQKGELDLKKIMRTVQFIPENWRVIDLLKHFQAKKTEFGVVVDELGATMGVVTLEDIIEELVGDIQDEHDQELALVELIGENRYRILAQNSVDDINELLPFDFPLDDDYETLSGLITKYNNNIANEGDIIRTEKFEIKIIKMFRTSPEIVEVSLLTEGEESGV